uniref:hypothetical protein n=1 Tax=Streptomyces erythrochromogenes TaxID=285574 RepID=UPI0038B4C45F
MLHPPASPDVPLYASEPPPAAGGGGRLRRSEADPWVQIPPGHVTNGGTPLTAWLVSMTSGRTPALVWNTTDTVDPDGSVQIRADFTGPAGATGATQPLAVVVDRNASGAATVRSVRAR